MFSSLKLVAAGGSPSCSGGTGSGTSAAPWTGASSCTLPFGSRLNVQLFSFYTLTAADHELPGHQVSDTAMLTWHDELRRPVAHG